MVYRAQSKHSRTDENHQGCPRGEHLILGFRYEEISFLVILQQSLHVFEFMLIQNKVWLSNTK